MTDLINREDAEAIFRNARQEFAAYSSDIADEFCANDSEYQAEVLNIIGKQFRIWSQDKKRTSLYLQILEIAEQLSDNGKWFIKTLCEHIDDKTEVKPQERSE